MRRLIVIGFFISLAPVVQSSGSSASTADRYWIFFVDKGERGGKVSTPIDLGERTESRRMRRASASGEWYDLPVFQPYVDAIEGAGVDVHVKSRWLNAVSATLSIEHLSILSPLQFVRKIVRVGEVSTPEPDDIGGIIDRAVRKTFTLDYGPSYQQLAFVNAIEPLESGLNGSGVRIGFLDTQYDFQHPALRHIVNDGRLVEVRDFTAPNRDRFGADQVNFHGLNVASIAVGYDPGNLIGPGYGAEVMAATTEFAPTETNQEEDNFVAALEWMEAQGVDVVNVSLGYTTFDAGERSYTPEEMDGDTGVTTIAADIAVSLGVVMVVSAGNAGSGAWRIIGTPADGDSVIAVGAAAVDSSRATFSSLGPTADGRIKPDVSAMGTSVLVAIPNGGYATGSGTSFSSPMVAGIVTQMLQANPDLDPMSVLEILRATASQSGNPNNELGWGIVDAAAAVREADRRTLDVECERACEAAIRLTAYPNPFDDRLQFEILAGPRGDMASLTLYDALGREVATVFSGTLDSGRNMVAIENPSLVPGVYFYRLETASTVATGKVVHVR